MSGIACLEGCGRVGVCRGVCMTCHNRQRVAIRKGETTDAKLIEQGKRTPVNKRTLFRRKFL